MNCIAEEMDAALVLFFYRKFGGPNRSNQPHKNRSKSGIRKLMGTSNEASNTAHGAGIKEFFGGLAGALIQRARYGDIEERLMRPASCGEDKFYVSLAGCQLADEWLKHKLEKHIATGDTSKLANYVGICRRTFEHHPPGTLGDLIKVAVAILRKDGRTVTLGSENPREWISRTDGSPRW